VEEDFMIRTASLLFAAGLAVFGQSTGAAGNTSPSTTGGTERTLTGVLMDATCQAIASRGTVQGGSMRVHTASGSTNTASGSTSNSTGATSGASSASAQGTTGAATGGNQASSSQGTSQSEMQTVTQAGRQSSTAGVHGQTGATSGADSASAQGTTGSAPVEVNQAGTPGNTKLSSQTGETGLARSDTSNAARTGERSRSADSVSTTIRDKYRDCIAKETTTSFAIHADGSLYVLDRAGNDLIRQQMGGEAFRGSMTNAAGAPQWVTVTVQGTANGDSLTITSVRR
jgi:hypothetical protein